MPQSDIVPPNRRSIRNIEPTARSGKKRAKKVSPESRPPKSSNGRGRMAIWIIAVLVLAALGAAVTLLFTGASVSVTPKARTVTIDGTFTAFAGGGKLPFEVITIEHTARESAEPTGTEEVAEHASGQITIYNDYDENPQRLITNTRFETPDGLIYRINEPVVVPGQQTEGGETVPGSLTVTVYADQPGEAYNIGRTSFTVPGFADSPRFEAFSAESVTPMTGGFVGTRPVVDDATEDAARERLSQNLTETLPQRVLAQIPDGYTTDEGSIFVETNPAALYEEGDSVVIEERGTAHALMFDKRMLAGFILENTLGDADDAAVTILDASGLEITVLSDDPAPWENESLEVRISGEATIVWEVDTDALKESLAGSSEAATEMILEAFPGIQTIQVSIRPFWRDEYPEESEEIRISLKEPDNGLTQ